MENKKINIWNLDQEFEQICGQQIWESLFGLNANNNMPSNLIENIGIARQEAIEIMSNVLADTNFSPDTKFEALLNQFWTQLPEVIDESDYQKAYSIKPVIDSYILHGLTSGYEMIKNAINLEQLAKTNWLDIESIIRYADKYIDDNFKNELVKALLTAIDVAGYQSDDLEELRRHLITLISDLTLFYINICGISESVINNHGFVSMDVLDNQILVTYQNKQKVASTYDITNNLTKSLSLSSRKEHFE